MTSTDPAETEHRPRGPVGHLVDLLVCAPIGFVLDAPSMLPRWIDRGRRQADATLQALGLAPLTRPSGPDDTDGRLVVLPVASNHDEPPTADPVVPAGPVTGSDRAPATPPVPTGPPVESLAITDYDSLSASQVVPRLESLEADELETVRSYELANRARKTILSKIALLQGS